MYVIWICAVSLLIRLVVKIFSQNRFDSDNFMIGFLTAAIIIELIIKYKN